MFHEFDTIYDGTKRPAEYGTVKVYYEQVGPGTTTRLIRPVRAHGFILPQGTTKGRKTAPEPLSGSRIGMTKTVPQKFLAISARNMGVPDQDKGHIIALELGGPDVAANICPQWSHFQRSGEWRKMEETALKLALEAETAGQKLHMTVVLVYVAAQTVKRALTPKGFVVDLNVDGPLGRNLGHFEIENTHNDTDDMMAFRQFAKIDPLPEGEDEESERARHQAYLVSRRSLGPPPSVPGFDTAQAHVLRQQQAEHAQKVLFGGPASGAGEGGFG